MQVSVIIVNYNTAHLIAECLQSVLQQSEVEFEIIVVDNKSHDNSLEVLAQFQDKIKVIANAENVGFGRANNQAIAISEGRFLFLLNPDAILQDTRGLSEMVKFMQNHPYFGIAGTQVIKTVSGGYSPPQKLYPGQQYTNLDFAELPGEIAWVIGASMMVRRDVFFAVRGFDEDYFLYGEEADLCLRIRKLGFQVGYNPLVVVQHIGGASEKNTPTQQLWRKKQQGLHLFLKKNYPPEEALKVVLHYFRRAQRRVWVLKLRKWLHALTHEQNAKLARYQAVMDASRQFLEKVD